MRQKVYTKIRLGMYAVAGEYACANILNTFLKYNKMNNLTLTYVTKTPEYGWAIARFYSN